MSTSAAVSRPSTTAKRRVTDRPVAAPWFHWVAAILSTWFITGAYLDAWAHGNLASLETFFTPWHGVLYSGAASVMLFMAFMQFRGVSQGYAFTRALPEGYGLTLLGLLGFAVGGVGDLLWHTAFGIERDIEAAISPTHLFLLLSGVFIISGPLRAGWRREHSQAPRGLTDWGPIILSMTITLLFLNTLPQVIHPLTRVYAATHAEFSVKEGELLGAAGILLNGAILSGFTLLIIRRWRVPAGTFTFIFTCYAIGLAFMQGHYEFIPGVVLTGILTDVLNRGLHPGLAYPGKTQLFAFAVPFIFYLLYFVTIMFTGGLWWRIHMWLGMCFIAGAVGIGLSMLLLPSWLPTSEADQPPV